MGVRLADDVPAEVTVPAPRAVWQRIAAASPEALAFHTPAWMDSILASGRYEDASRLYETPSGNVLLLPIARRRGHASVFRGRHASAPYGWGFGGILSSAPLTAQDVALVTTDLVASGDLIAIRPNPLLRHVWHDGVPPSVARVPRIAHVLDLEGGFEHVFAKRFRGTARTATRKAERSSLTVECSTDGTHLDAFLDLYRLSVDRWARQSRRPIAVARWLSNRRDPPEKFADVVRHMGAAARLWIAWRGDDPAAALICLVHGQAASYWRGCMNEEIASPTRANYLLHRLAIEDVCASGCRFYHMGETGTSSSLAQFKTALGAQPYSYEEYRFASGFTRHLSRAAPGRRRSL